MILQRKFLVPLLFFLINIQFEDVWGQFRQGTERFAEMYERNSLQLSKNVSTSISALDVTYSFNFPLPEQYKIGLLVNPCKGHPEGYSCCQNKFGMPEYPKLKRDGLEQDRIQKKITLGNETEIRANFDLIYEDGSPIPYSAQRMADDEYYLDYECQGLYEPMARCRGKNFGHRKSAYVPACMDNNQTVNVSAGCTV